MVDIILICYNQEQYIEECLNSIKEQSYTQWNIIFIDNSSTDNSVKVAKHWFEKHEITPKKFIVSEKNIGICAGLNKALEHCSSPFIKILAVDDYLHPDYLFKTVHAFQHAERNVKVIYTYALRVNENGDPLEDHYYLEKITLTGRDFLRLLYKKNPIAAPSVLLRADVYDEVGVYDPDSFFEDYDLWLRIAKSGYNFHQIPETLTYYRVVSSGMTQSKSFQINDEKIHLMIKHDTSGAFKKEINSALMVLSKMDGDFKASKSFSSYQKYPYNNPILNTLLKYHLPTIPFKVLQKLSLA